MGGMRAAGAAFVLAGACILVFLCGVPLAWGYVASSLIAVGGFFYGKGVE